MDGEALAAMLWAKRKRASQQESWPTINGWTGVIFLTLLIPLPVSGFPDNTTHVH